MAGKLEAANQLAILVLKGALSDMPAADRLRVQEAHDKIMEIVNEYGDHGSIALSLAGCENAATN